MGKRPDVSEEGVYVTLKTECADEEGGGRDEDKK